MPGVEAREQAVAPARVYVLLAGVCVAGIATVGVLAQPRSPMVETMVVLGVQGVICMMIARLPRSSPLRAAAVVLVSLLVVQSGYFFGPASAFAAVLAIILVVTGILSKQTEQPWLGWAVLVAIAGGELAIVVLVSTDLIDDRSLSPILTPHGHRQTIGGHIVLQSVMIAAFVAGRLSQNRYRRLLGDAVDAARRAATREVLLAEARVEYTRAVALREAATDKPAPARRAVPSEEVPTLEHRSPESRSKTEAAAATFDHIVLAVEPQPERRDSRLVLDDGADHNWTAAYQSKLRGQDAFVLALCLAGIILTTFLVPESLPRYFTIASIAGIASMIAIRSWLQHRKPDGIVAWPWDVIAALSVGPAYGFGPHSGFASIIATALFVAGLFNRRRSRSRKHLAVGLVCLAHGALFAAIAIDVLPDGSNLLVFPADQPRYTAYLQHAMLQGVFVAAYGLGLLIDGRFVEVYERARDAIRACARSDARLHVARTEIDAARGFGEGLFTGTEVGPYRVGRLIGRGSMGEVYIAEHAGQRVALKVIRADRIADPFAQQRFEDEAKLLLRVGGPYCARVLDVGRDAELPYLAMEHVEGRSLAAVLRERELTPTELVGFISDVTHGLADIHAAGVVHLDLKPANLLFGETAHGRRWSIVDFGASVLAGDDARALAGTPQYMAPEQALGQAIDPRTDLYAVALILYRLIAGRPAYVGSDRRVIAREALELGPPDPRDTAALAEDVALVLRIGLAAVSADRFASAVELRTAVLAALTGRLDERTRARGRELVARAPWAMRVAA